MYAPFLSPICTKRLEFKYWLSQLAFVEIHALLLQSVLGTTGCIKWFFFCISLHFHYVFQHLGWSRRWFQYGYLSLMVWGLPASTFANYPKQKSQRLIGDHFGKHYFNLLLKKNFIEIVLSSLFLWRYVEESLFVYALESHSFSCNRPTQLEFLMSQLFHGFFCRPSNWYDDLFRLSNAITVGSTETCSTKIFKLML